MSVLTRLLARNDGLFDIYCRTHARSFYELYLNHRFVALQSEISDGRREADIDMSGIKMSLSNLSRHDQGIYLLSQQNQSYEPETVELIRSILKQDDIFIDIGANNGYFSLIASRIVGDAGKVYAFEPTPFSYLRLCKNLILNHTTNVIPYRLALGECRSAMPLYESLFEDGLNSLIEIPNSKVNREVPVFPIDELIDEAQVIKIDAEGYEAEILRGGRTLLEKSDDLKIIFEYNKYLLWRRGGLYGDSIRFLQELGYLLYAIDSRSHMTEVSNHKEVPSTLCNLMASRRDFPYE